MVLLFSEKCTRFLTQHIVNWIWCIPNQTKYTLFSLVLFITYFRLDTCCTYFCKVTSGKNCQNPHESVLVKTTLFALFPTQHFMPLCPINTYCGHITHVRYHCYLHRRVVSYGRICLLGLWSYKYLKYS